jgi:hypothetical protein
VVSIVPAVEPAVARMVQGLSSMVVNLRALVPKRQNVTQGSEAKGAKMVPPALSLVHG